MGQHHASLGQQDRNAGLVQHRLRSQESALADVGTQLNRARELAIQANSGAMSAQDRASIAAELRAVRSELLAIANRDDGNGRRLFAGSRDGIIPFADNGGTVSYAGDDGRNADGYLDSHDAHPASIPVTYMTANPASIAAI